MNKPTKVKDIEHLKELAGKIENGMLSYHDFFILLGNGNIRSSKDIMWDGEKFQINNNIDDTEQELTEEQIMDDKYTNIGEAIRKGAFYKY